MEALRRGIWLFCSALYNLLLLLWSGICSECTQAHGRQVFPQRSCSLAVTLEGHSASLPGGLRGGAEIRQSFNGGELDISLDAIRSTSGKVEVEDNRTPALVRTG